MLTPIFKQPQTRLARNKHTHNRETQQELWVPSISKIDLHKLQYQNFTMCAQFIIESSNQMQQLSPFLVLRNHRPQHPPPSLLSLKKRKPTHRSWTHSEHLGYLKFFDENREIVSTSAERKANKMFVQMARYIPTRSSSQIKSHHQKLMDRFRSLDTILQKIATQWEDEDQQEDPVLSYYVKLEPSISEQEDQNSQSQQLHLAQQAQTTNTRSDTSAAATGHDQQIFDVLEGLGPTTHIYSPHP